MRSSVCLALAGLAMVTFWQSPAWSHHSHGNYQMTEYTHLTGVVRELHWMNPHTWIYLDVVDEDGNTTLWALEGGSPGFLERRGWSADSIKAGDEIKVRCHQLRDGAPGCLLGFVTPPNGVEMEWD